MKVNNEKLSRIYRMGAVGPAMDVRRLMQLASGRERAARDEIQQLSSSTESADMLLNFREVAAWSTAAESPKPDHRLWRYAAAAVALLGAGWLGWLQLDARQMPALRGDIQSAYAPADGGSGQWPESLAWPAVSKARAYQVTLYDDRLQAIWTSDWLTDNRLELPATSGIPLSAGPYFWRVTVDTGLRFDELPLKSFVLEDFRQ